MACIRKRRGKWVLDYRDQHGVRRWETTSANRKKANDILTERIREIRDEIYQSPAEQKTFTDLVEIFRDARMGVNHVRLSTRKDYDDRLRLHLIPYFGDRKIRTIAPEVVERFKAHLLEKFKRHREERIRKL